MLPGFRGREGAGILAHVRITLPRDGDGLRIAEDAVGHALTVDLDARKKNGSAMPPRSASATRLDAAREAQGQVLHPSFAASPGSPWRTFAAVYEQAGPPPRDEHW
jgi:hypothetical protein